MSMYFVMNKACTLYWSPDGWVKDPESASVFPWEEAIEGLSEDDFVADAETGEVWSAVG